MFKFIQQYSETIKGVHVYAFISLFIFFIFFIVLLVFVKKMGKKQITELSNIPLDETEISNTTL